jgi:hypothetical protein
VSSSRQIEANKLNAQRSTGPLTAEGKGRVGSNALKHGLTGKQLVLPNENADDFDEFRRDLLNSLDPQGALEEFLANKIIADAWRLKRVPLLEAAIHERTKAERALSELRGRTGSYRKVTKELVKRGILDDFQPHQTHHLSIEKKSRSKTRKAMPRRWQRPRMRPMSSTVI